MNTADIDRTVEAFSGNAMTDSMCYMVRHEMTRPAYKSILTLLYM